MEALGRAIIDAIAEEWRKQGHRLTGAFEEAMSYEVNGDELIIYDNTERGYGKILDEGVPADRIPYTVGGGRRGGTSKYIQGLASYAQLRMGTDSRTALSIAFAIAAKHAKEGMPTINSRRYSQTGKRTKFVEDSVPRIDALVEEFTDKLVFS